jgi:hypothetical protein
MKKVFSFLSIFVIAGLLVGGLSLAIPSRAFALGAQGPAEEALTKAYKAEQKWLKDQQQALDKADQAAAQVQQVIDKTSAAGLDVSALQNALAAFNSSLAEVKTGHQTTAGILAAHTGFDNAGNVTDRQSARVTVLDARQALGKAHVTLVQAAQNLHQAFVW